VSSQAKSSGTILVWGLLSDSPVAAVHDALLARKADFFFLDQRAILDTEIELRCGAALEGEIRLPQRTIDLGDICAIYLRPSDSRQIPVVAAAGPDSEAMRHAVTVEDILYSWADLTPAFVLNRPSAMAANNSKPFQSAWIEALGFRIPDTLLTTDPAQALAFWQHHGRVIYKSISGTRSIVAQLSEQHHDRLAHVAACPTQFQQYIAGTEYRVHVVGDQVFACSVSSGAIDYRYSAIPYVVTPCRLPSEVAARCVELSRAMDLPLAGLDLRCTPEGAWYCFEVNPSPAFSCFERPEDQRIAGAIAGMLGRTRS
jgi:predicted ATP-grasp superfamily ATP-dependent carboligase